MTRAIGVVPTTEQKESIPHLEVKVSAVLPAGEQAVRTAAAKLEHRARAIVVALRHFVPPDHAFTPSCEATA